MRRISRPVVLGAIVALSSAGFAFADRAPTPEERAAIEARLQQLGFTSWEDIELEDDGSVWEVDDAVAADGREYDLKLDPASLDVIRQELDD